MPDPFPKRTSDHRFRRRPRSVQAHVRLVLLLAAAALAALLSVFALLAG
jgi:hypothetical protein